jgi:ABC-2 type transport system ATP-binding protein
MKQRLGIAQALINRPKLLICDEPTSALDPVGRKEILDIVSAAREQTSVLFSTHILSDVERICDHVAFLEGGKTAFSGSTREIHGLKGDSDIELVLASPADLNRVAERFTDSKLSDGRLILPKASDKKCSELLRFLSENDIPLIRLERIQADVEQLFLEVVGR